jgi:WD40 repeat protein
LTTGADATIIVTPLTGEGDLAFGSEKVSIGGEVRGFIATAPGDSSLHAVLNHKQELVILKDGKVASTTAMPKEGRCVCFSDDNTVWVGGDKKGGVISFTLSAGGAECKLGSVTMAESDDRVEQLASNGKDIVAAVNGLKEVYLFRPSTGELLNKNLWKVHTGAVTSCAFSPDGTKFATGSADESVMVFTDLVGFRPTRQKAVGLCPLGVTYVAWLDDSTIVAVGKDKSARTITVASE